VSGGGYGYSRAADYRTRAASPVDYLYPLEAMRRAQLQAAAEAQMARLLREVSAAAQRLEIGDRAYQQGDIRLASGIYVRLAGSHPPNPITLQARDRLTSLAQEARDKLGEIDASLVPTAAPADGSAHAPYSGPLPADKVVEAFQAYDEVVAKYAGVPAAKRELAAHVTKQRKKPEYAAVLNEAQAKRLLELAQGHAERQELCCAYWVYQDAARLVPAPSALQARERFAALGADPETVRAAETCRELRWCHKAFQRAEMLAKLKPENARRVYGEILSRAPADSEIYRAARAEYNALAGR
jgi:hypothetical protein